VPQPYTVQIERILQKGQNIFSPLEIYLFFSSLDVLRSSVYKGILMTDNKRSWERNYCCVHNYCEFL